MPAGRRRALDLRLNRAAAADAGERALDRRSVAPAAACLLAAGLLAFALQLRSVWPFTADDAFITFRHAQNWAAGFGPNFNATGARSEGVTSFGFLALCTLPALLGLDLVVFAKLAGVLGALATAALLARLALDLERALPAAAAAAPAGGSSPAGRALLAAAGACFLWLGFHATAVHAASGMETLVACALLTALARAVLRARSAPEPAGPGFGLLALALGLVRPELNAAAAAALALALAGTPAATRPALLRSALLFWLLPGALYFAARATYYGELLPIPFYAKIAGGAALPGAANALDLGKTLLGGVGLFALLPLLAAPRAFRWLLALALAVVGIALLPDPVMDFDFRYALPALPLCFALSGLGLAQLAEIAARALAPLRGGSRRLIVTALSLTAAASLAARAIEPARASLQERRAYGLALLNTNVRLGRILADYRRQAARVPLVALGDVGAIPYYSGWRVIDTYSLNDPEIAIRGRGDPAYVLDQSPDLVIAVSTRGREFAAHWANPHDPALFEASRARGMRPAVILRFSAASYLFVMAQPDSEIERSLRRVYLDRPDG